ncbi:MAG: ribokinase [Dermatophilaceae bacterium]
MSGRVLVLGSLNVDLVTSVDRHPRPGETVTGAGLRRLAGGKGANQAVAAARAGAAVSMVGCLGDDVGGAAYLDRLARLRVDVAAVRVVAGTPTGHALVAVDGDGENTIVVVPGANARLDEREVEAVDRLGRGDVLLTQLEVPRRVVCAAVRRASARGARVVLNAAPFGSLPGDVLAMVDPVVVNEHEMAALAEAGTVPSSLVVTFGAHGASWDGVTHPARPVPPAEVVDTTGAGDAFCGVLAAALARGADRDAAMDAALRAGADAIRHDGAQPHPDL